MGNFKRFLVLKNHEVAIGDMLKSQSVNYKIEF